ncbi:universal stress protein [Natrialbaceae archaeon A-gly3]
MYDDVLVPTDGSEGATYAAEHAVAIADPFDATVHALSVTSEGPYGADKRDQLRADEKGEAEEAVATVEKLAADAGLETTTTVQPGVPHEAILEYAETEPVDLIVMGTAGRSGLESVLIGSAAERVVRNSRVPVVTVRLDAD